MKVTFDGDTSTNLITSESAAISEGEEEHSCAPCSFLWEEFAKLIGA